MIYKGLHWGLHIDSVGLVLWLANIAKGEVEEGALGSSDVTLLLIALVLDIIQLVLKTLI